MHDLNFIEIDTTTFVLIISALDLLLQLLLCFKAKNSFLKLIPVVLLTVSAIVFSVLSACIGGWDGIGCLFFALFSVGLLFVSGIGWAIWAISGKGNR